MQHRKVSLKEEREAMACMSSMPSALRFIPSRRPESSTSSSSMSLKAGLGVRLGPGRLWPQHPQRGGKNEGNAQQHETRAAMRDGAGNSAPCQNQTRQQALINKTNAAITEHKSTQSCENNMRLRKMEVVSISMHCAGPRCWAVWGNRF
jgi:hypothetical protein